MLGVYSDRDYDFRRDPTILVGTCEGIAHVPGLIKDLQATMEARVGVRDPQEYFWSGSMSVAVRDGGGA